MKIQLNELLPRVVLHANIDKVLLMDLSAVGTFVYVCTANAAQLVIKLHVSLTFSTSRLAASVCVVGTFS